MITSKTLENAGQNTSILTTELRKILSKNLVVARKIKYNIKKYQKVGKRYNDLELLALVDDLEYLFEQITAIDPAGTEAIAKRIDKKIKLATLQAQKTVDANTVHDISQDYEMKKYTLKTNAEMVDLKDQDGSDLTVMDFLRHGRYVITILVKDGKIKDYINMPRFLDKMMLNDFGNMLTMASLSCECEGVENEKTTND